MTAVDVERLAWDRYTISALSVAQLALAGALPGNVVYDLALEKFETDYAAWREAARAVGITLQPWTPRVASMNAAHQEHARERVVLDIMEERERQENELGYDTAHDDLHGIDHLVKWAGWYANGAHATITDCRAGRDPECELVEYTHRQRLIQAASLLVAAVELIDRQAIPEERRTALPHPHLAFEPEGGWTAGVAS